MEEGLWRWLASVSPQLPDELLFPTPSCFLHSLSAFLSNASPSPSLHHLYALDRERCLISPSRYLTQNSDRMADGWGEHTV